MGEVERIEDARDRLKAAGKLLDEADYAGAMSEAQRCIELSVKALLDKLNINYMKGKRVSHDVSDNIPEAFEKLKPYLEDYEVDIKRKELAQAAVLLRFLTSIRSYLEFGVEHKVGNRKLLLASPREVFDFSFGKALANIVVELVKSCHWRIYDLISKTKF